MNGDTTIGLLALQRIGAALRAGYSVRTRVPFRLYRLIAQLARITKEDDYRQKAMEALHLAQRTPSSPEKTRLVKLAEGWVELADKAHEDNQRPRRPTILHPLVQKKLGGDLPD
jgi:hypothetical protein